MTTPSAPSRRRLLNWFLSLAPLCAARDGRDTLSSVGEAVRLFRRRRGDFTSVGVVYGVLRLLAIGAALMLSLAVLQAGWLSARSQIAWLVVLSLVYFAVADFLYIARLAAYGAIAELDVAPPQWAAGVAASPAAALLPKDVAGDIAPQAPPLAGQS